MWRFANRKLEELGAEDTRAKIMSIAFCLFVAGVTYFIGSVVLQSL